MAFAQVGISPADAQLILSVNSILRYYQHEMQLASPKGKTILRREVLQLADFDFWYFAHLYCTDNGNMYHFCYDYGYLPLPRRRCSS